MSTRPMHARQQSISLLPPPTQAFLTQIYQNTTIPYTSLPSKSTQIVLMQDNRYTFSYMGTMSVGQSPYRHFSLQDSWMERSWSVYALDAPRDDEDEDISGLGGGLRRAGSLSSQHTSSTGSGSGEITPRQQWFTGAGVMGSSERRAVKNEEVRNALTSAFLTTISRSLPSIEVVI